MTFRIDARLVAFTITVIAAFAAMALFSTHAGATVPPKNCGKLTVGSRAFTIKADGVRCSTAKSHSGRYLRTRRAPSGWRCRSYSGSRMAFRCTRGDRVIFAIKR